jgi:hypothetical protein
LISQSLSKEGTQPYLLILQKGSLLLKYIRSNSSPERQMHSEAFSKREGLVSSILLSS